MAFKKHDRTYDLVLFGATGYTGQYAAEYIVRSLPTNLRWAISGRSANKLAQLADDLKKLNPDRIPPAVEVCNVDETELAQLAKATFIMATTVGPYSVYGEPAFKACAEAGTHYVDITGELPFVGRMIKKYQATAMASGALMFPISGIESAPAVLVACSIAKILRERLHAKTGDVTAAVDLKGMPSGGTLNSVIAIFEQYSVAEFLFWTTPFALSPVKQSNMKRGGSKPLVEKLTGTATHPRLGAVTHSVAGSSNAAMVERTWGLLYGRPEDFGPNFTFFEYAKAKSWLHGVATAWALAIGSLLLLILPPIRWLAKRLLYQPGQGPARDDANRAVTYTAVGNPDPLDAGVTAGAPKQQAYCKATFNGCLYKLTGILMAEVVLRLLEDDLELRGGVYTVAVLGQKYIDRLDKSGFHIETELVDA